MKHDLQASVVGNLACSSSHHPPPMHLPIICTPAQARALRLLNLQPRAPALGQAPWS